jgi:hypothetical protein
MLHSKYFFDEFHSKRTEIILKQRIISVSNVLFQFFWNEYYFSKQRIISVLLDWIFHLWGYCDTFVSILRNNTSFSWNTKMISSENWIHPPNEWNKTKLEIIWFVHLDDIDIHRIIIDENSKKTSVCMDYYCPTVVALKWIDMKNKQKLVRPSQRQADLWSFYR